MKCIKLGNHLNFGVLVQFYRKWFIKKKKYYNLKIKKMPYSIIIIFKGQLVGQEILYRQNLVILSNLF